MARAKPWVSETFTPIPLPLAGEGAALRYSYCPNPECPIPHPEFTGGKGGESAGRPHS